MLSKLTYVSERGIWQANLTGELDAYHAPKFVEEMEAAYQANPGSFELDCSHLEYIDSVGLGAMVKALKIAQQDENGIILKKIHPRVYKLFHITGLDGIFQIEVAN